MSVWQRQHQSWYGANLGDWSQFVVTQSSKRVTMLWRVQVGEKL